MPTASHLLVVEATIGPDIETDWNAWYDKTHLPEIAACPGFFSGTRYVSTDANGDRRYLTVYELSDPKALRSKEFGERRGWGPFTGKVEFSSRCFSAIRGSIGEDT
jgi:antibiotic biosynthesis monooxygenase (ABM) superfamily enzyme